MRCKEYDFSFKFHCSEALKHLELHNFLPQQQVVIYLQHGEQICNNNKQHVDKTTLTPKTAISKLLAQTEITNKI